MGKVRLTFTATALATVLALVASPAGAVSSTDSASVPGAPTITSVTPEKQALTVTFTEPARDGGAPISQYQARCKPIGKGDLEQAYANKSPIVVNGVAPGRSYRCVVVARNRVGPGPRSAPFTSIAVGTSCATTSGTMTFIPPLPKPPKLTLVKDKVEFHGKVGDCHGGGVTSGAITAVSTRSPGSNCTTFASTGAIPVEIALTVLWDTHATSTIALSVEPQHGRPTQPKLTGQVTAGLFKGMSETATISLRLRKGACATVDLSALDFAATTALVIA